MVQKSAADHKRLPQQFGAFLLDKALWRGAHSCVYYATDLRDQAAVAVKILYPNSACGTDCQQRNALREASRLREIKHPNIVELRQHGEADGLPYLSFPFVDGQSIDHALAAAAPRAVAECMIKVSRALHHAHGKGIIHRDLKPRNVLVDSAGQPFVLDWGLSWHTGDAPEAGVQQIVGTPAYMSPEQARGSEAQLTPASDVYSLGAILYHLLTGRPPFDADTTWKTLQMSMSLPPVPPGQLRPGLDSRLERVVMICLEKDLKQRYETAEALAADLERIYADQNPKGKSGMLGRLLS